MDALIRIDTGNGDELRDLGSWLTAEPGLRGHVQLIPAPVAETELGSLTDAISVAVGAGGAGTVLASSLVTWLQTRRSRVRLLIQKGNSRVVLDLETSDRLLPMIERLLEPGDEH